MCQGLADLYRQLGRGEDAGRMELELAKHSDEVCGAADVALVKVRSCLRRGRRTASRLYQEE